MAKRPVPAVPKTPVSPPFQVSAVTVLDAARGPEGSLQMKGGVGEAQKLLPPERSVNVWKADSDARLAVETHNGSKVITMTNTAGEPSAQLMTRSGKPVAAMKARRGYRLAVDYATKLTGKARVGGVEIRFVDYAKPGVIGVNLPATGGQWKTAAVTFRSPIDSPLVLFVSLLVAAASAAGGVLWAGQRRARAAFAR